MKYSKPLVSRMKRKPILFLIYHANYGVSETIVAFIKKYNYEKRTVIYTGLSNFKAVRELLPYLGVCRFWGSISNRCSIK